MARDLPAGIRHTKYGFEVRARVGSSAKKTLLERSKHFSKGAAIRDMKAWRDAEIVRLRAELTQKVGPTPARGTLAQDIERYLKLVAAMPSYDSRARDLEAWRDRFGDLPRYALTPERIREQLQAWRLHGPRYRWKRGKKGQPSRMDQLPGGLSASACNHRRTALLHLFTLLDGKDGRNPVRDVPPFREPAPEPRGKDLELLARAIARVHSPVNRAWLSVLLWTGMRVSELARMKREHVDLVNAVCYVPTAKGGKGYRPVPLNANAIAAWRDFIAVNRWGPIDRKLLRQSLKRAYRKEVPLEVVRVHDLRHSLARAYLQAGADLADVQELLGHTTPRMTRRYAPFSLEKLAAVSKKLERVDAAVGKSSGEDDTTDVVTTH